MCCALLPSLPSSARAEGLKVDPAQAADGPPSASPAGQAAQPYWRLWVAPAAYHWQYNPQHRPVWAVGADWQKPDGWFLGGSYFRNSFDQPSAYLYVGKRWDGLLGRPAWFAEVSGGLIYGYRGQFANKVPFNHNGYSPGLIVTGGWRLDEHSDLDLDLLGTAAILFRYSYSFK